MWSTKWRIFSVKWSIEKWLNKPSILSYLCIYELSGAKLNLKSAEIFCFVTDPGFNCPDFSSSN